MVNNNQTMVAKIEIVGEGGKKAKIKFSRQDIERLCKGKGEFKYHNHTNCKQEEWLDKRNSIDLGPKIQ